MNAQTATKGRTLIVHDDMHMRHTLGVAMHHAGYEVDFAENADEALSKARELRPTVVITDLHMSGMSDASTLDAIRNAVPDMSIVVLTTANGIGSAVDTVRAVADDYVTKPVDPAALHLAVERAVDRKKQRAETDLLRSTLAELRQAHRALELERDFVATVLATTESLVAVLDAQGHIVRCNAACERVTGYTEAELCSPQALELLVEGEELTHARQSMAELLSGQTRRCTYENHWRSKNGERHRIMWTVSSLPEGTGAVKHVVASGLDVTDIRNMEIRVRRSEHLASIATFSAGVVHEIKNPLNAATLHLQLLNRLLGRPGLDIDAAREASTIATSEIRRVATLLEEFLQFARPVKPRRTMTDLRRICDDVVQLCKVEAEGAHVELAVVGDAQLDILADDARMRQVILNLVRNAIEAVRKSGYVEVAVAHDEQHAYVRVQDDGPGLAADEVKIFQPFFTTKDKGTGLGLAITHRIVTDHGGDISVSNRPGKTTFTVQLPLAAPEKNATI